MPWLDGLAEIAKDARQLEGVVAACARGHRQGQESGAAQSGWCALISDFERAVPSGGGRRTHRNRVCRATRFFLCAWHIGRGAGAYRELTMNVGASANGTTCAAKKHCHGCQLRARQPGLDCAMAALALCVSKTHFMRRAKMALSSTWAVVGDEKRRSALDVQPEGVVHRQRES